MKSIIDFLVRIFLGRNPHPKDCKICTPQKPVGELHVAGQVHKIREIQIMQHPFVDRMGVEVPGSIVPDHYHGGFSIVDPRSYIPADFTVTGTLTVHGVDEGDVCGRNGCDGVLVMKHQFTEGGCSCFRAAPCGYCMSEVPECPTCGWVSELP